MRRTLSPAISPASLVAWRSASLKYAGTVMTASVTVLAEVALGVALELLQDERADLLRGEVLAVDRLLPVGADVALDRPDGALDVGDRLALGDLADQHLAVLGEGDDRGVVRAPSAFAMTEGSPPSRTATQELVVPRSIPPREHGYSVVVSPVAQVMTAEGRTQFS
jgi:hypothetical protein